MAITRARKGEIVEKLSQALKDAKSFVFVNFRGLKVAQTTEMRRVLKGEKVAYAVAKKSLIDRALTGEKIDGVRPDLLGELALAWGDDLIAPAREVYGFQKKFPESLKILGGIFEGRYMSAEAMEGIAKIPGLDVLRGKFVNIINSPIQRFVIGLNEISKTK